MNKQETLFNKLTIEDIENVLNEMYEKQQKRKYVKYKPISTPVDYIVPVMPMSMPKNPFIYDTTL